MIDATHQAVNNPESLICDLVYSSYASNRDNGLSPMSKIFVAQYGHDYVEAMEKRYQEELCTHATN